MANHFFVAIALGASHGCGASSIFAERKAHAPLLARAEGYHGVVFVVTGNHLNETASRGCNGASCSALYFLFRKLIRIIANEGRKENINLWQAVVVGAINVIERVISVGLREDLAADFFPLKC